MIRPRKLLLVTNDFPPRQGGIQSMLFELASRLPAQHLAVYCSDYTGAAEFDRNLAYPVRRDPAKLLIPTPAARRRVLAAAAEFGSTAVWFGAAAPLALLAPSLRKHGIERVVATSHGHEVGWSKLPLARQALRRIGNNADAVTYLGSYTRTRLQRALGPHPMLVQLSPGVDTDVFNPGVDGAAIRQRYGLTDCAVIACISRLVARKGQDVLIQALPAIIDATRGAGIRPVLLLVGDGPYRSELSSIARRLKMSQHVVFTGAVPASELSAHYAAGDLFAMPCRTRRWGMDVEGLGMVYLEASAVGLAVVAGNSGGAPDAVLAGRTGVVLDGRDVAAVASQIATLLSNPDVAAEMGRAGREWVQRSWQWDDAAARLADLLQL